MWSRIVRAVVSLVVSILPLLYFAGYLSFLYRFGIPSPASIFGLSGGIYGTGSPLVPVGATGITFILIFGILSRVGSMGASAMSRPRVPMQFGGMPFSGAVQNSSIPENLPADITKTQYVILRQYRSGITKPRDIAKSLSMEKDDVEKEAVSLKANGYISNKGKLTAKAMELLS